MAPGQRRRPARPAALTLVAAALFLAAGACSGEARAGDAAETAAAAPAVASPPASRARRLPQLGPRVEALVARWVEEARRRTDGAVNPSNVVVAVHVLEPASGRELVARQADRSLRPASNMKLVTTAAALFLLGPEVDFVTPFEAQGPVVDGRLRGDLVVRASGDPFWDSAGLGRVEGRLVAAAEEVRARGVEVIEGDLVLDEGRFLTPEVGPAWPAPSQHWAAYCARSAGFTLNAGILVAEITPGRAGAPAAIELHPAPTGLAPRLGVETTRGGPLDVRVGATATTVTVRGRLPAGSQPFVADFAHPDPVQLFAAVLQDALDRAGVRLEGELVRRRGTPVGEPLAALHSRLGDVLAPINAESINGVADQLFFALGETLGEGGTREASARVVAGALEALGVPTAGYHQVDGSGLSRDDRATARQLTALIAAVLRRDETSARAYLDSLAVMGQRGTLESRLRNTPAAGRVRAKTGWIAGVSALSGVARADDGPPLVFSILVEYPADQGGLNTHVFKKLQDELCQLLVATSAEAGR